MQRVMVDDDWLEQLRGGSVEFASRYTWEACARRTWEVYRAISGS